MTTQEEMEAIFNMLKRAAEYHLEVEVVLEFYCLVKGNPNRGLNECIYMALGEWDV